MDVFIAGSTGVLGTRLVRQLAQRGHRVLGLARDPRGDALVREAGGVPVRADLFDADSLARAADGAEVVIHAATRIPTNSRARSAWEMNDRIRRDGSRALSSAAARVGARVYLQQSVVWVICPPGGERYDESWTPNPAELVRSAVDGECIAADIAGGAGVAVGILRCGGFYGPDVPTTLHMVDLLRKRRLPIVGAGDSIIAPLHADDAASAFVAAAEAGSAGTWHIVDDMPVPMAKFLRELARIVGAPAPRTVPLWIARLIAGRAVVEAMTSSMNTTNRRARQELGWAPRYPSFWEGLAEMVPLGAGAAPTPRRPALAVDGP